MSLEESIKEAENLIALQPDLLREKPVFVEKDSGREYTSEDLNFVTEVITIHQNFPSEILLRRWVHDYIKANNLEANMFVYLEGMGETKIRIGGIKNHEKPL